MDRLDKFSVLAIVVFSAWAFFLILIQTEAPDSRAIVRRQKIQAAQYNDLELERKMKLARDLLAGNMQKAEEIISGLMEEFPYSGRVHLLKGDLHLYRQQPVQAMHSYRQAVDLNLDFLDKKTPLFQGKKIRNTVEEAEQTINKALTVQPDDAVLQRQKKEVYYMLRRIAGSCGG